MVVWLAPFFYLQIMTSNEGFNPFYSRKRDNFPPLTPYLDRCIEQDNKEDEEDEKEVDLSEHFPSVKTEESDEDQQQENMLDLSIDTLARVNPVDISNVSEFLAWKEQEEREEVKKKTNVRNYTNKRPVFAERKD